MSMVTFREPQSLISVLLLSPNALILLFLYGAMMLPAPLDATY